MFLLKFIFQMFMFWTILGSPQVEFSTLLQITGLIW